MREVALGKEFECSGLLRWHTVFLYGTGNAQGQEAVQEMITKPQRIQRRRSKGWRMPPNTVSVCRPERWGNPFIVGKHGTAERCVDLFRKMLAGYLCVGVDVECIRAQQRFMKRCNTVADLGLRGKNLACWCRLGQPCHADVLLKLANNGQ